MITTFKIFNTKTKEVKEYSKPEFGDFGRYIEISDCEIFPIHTDHELNTLHNGLFKDCIYTNGDWVGVLFHCFRYDYKIIHCLKYLKLPQDYSIVIKNGDCFNGSYFVVYENFSFNLYEKIITHSKKEEMQLLDINSKMNAICFLFNRNANEKLTERYTEYNKLSIETINYPERIKKYDEFELEMIENSKIKIDKNIIDEYFTKND